MSTEARKFQPGLGLSITITTSHAWNYGISSVKTLEIFLPLYFEDPVSF
jgi:hypothetical protein